MSTLNNIAVFCGSSFGDSEIYTVKAKELGEALAESGKTLVYGGGSRGLMGVIAETIHSKDGRVIGVIPEIFNNSKVIKKDIYSELLIVKGMHERKKAMYDRADGFIIMPGGIGTLEEFFEIFTWRQIGYHTKNIAIYNVNGFYDPLIAFLKSMVASGFVSEEVISSLIITDDAITLLSRLAERPARLPDKIE